MDSAYIAEFLLDLGEYGLPGLQRVAALRHCAGGGRRYRKHGVVSVDCGLETPMSVDVICGGGDQWHASAWPDEHGRVCVASLLAFQSRD